MSNYRFTLKKLLGKSRYEECISYLPEIQSEQSIPTHTNKYVDEILSPVFRAYSTERLNSMYHLLETCLNKKTKLYKEIIAACVFLFFIAVSSLFRTAPVLIITCTIYLIYIELETRAETRYKDMYFIISIKEIISRILESRER